jgi:PKD repeat protein
MKKFYRLFIGLCAMLFLMASYEAKASHVMGSDITWKCLGNGKYAIRVTAYRSCKGIPIQPGSITIKCAQGGWSHSGGTGPTGGDDITPVCKRSCTQCTSNSCSFDFGIQRWYYEDTVDLSSVGCCEFVISWGQCCRNGAITTGAGNADFYCEASFNKCKAQKPCDNSPYFTNPPVAIYCKDQCVIYNPAANDDDMNAKGEADSLSYETADPLSAQGSKIPYISGYSKDEPLRYDGYPDPNGEFDPPKCKGFHVDSETGEIKFKATESDVTVMAITVTEWRKDSLGVPQKIGTIRRDLQISVIECPENRSPMITGIDCGKSTTMTFCANQSKCFTVCSFDPDIDDTVTMDWNKQIPGADFDVEFGKKWPKGKFCWSPTNAHVRSYPWRFVVTGIDNACPVNGRTSKTFTLYVRPAPEGFIKQTKDKCGWVTLEAVLTNGKVVGSIKEYLWNGPYSPRDALVNVRGNTVKVKYKPNPKKIPSKYPISLTIASTAGCETVITDTVVIDQYVYADLGPDTTVCVNTPMKLKAKQYFGKAPYIYSWYVYNKATKAWDKKVDNVQDQTEYNITASDDKTVVVVVKDGNGCDNEDTLRIKAQIPPAPYLGKDMRGCAGTPIVLNATKNAADKVMPMIKSYNWYKADGSGGWISMPSGPTLAVKDSSTYRVIVTDSIGCSGTDEIVVVFNPLVDVEKKEYIVCKGDSSHMTGGVGGPGTTWQWFDLRRSPPQLVSTTKNYDWEPKGFTDKVMTVKFKVIASQTLFGVVCSDVDTQTVNIHPLPKVVAGQPDPQCIDNPPYDLTTITNFADGVPDNSGDWRSKSKPNAISANELYPKVLGVGKHWITYRYTNPVTKCYKDDSIQIEIVPTPTPKIIAPNYWCQRDGKLTLKASPQGGFWYTDDPNDKYLVGNSLTMQFDPTVAGPGAHKFWYSYKDNGTGQCDKDTPHTIMVYFPQKIDLGPDKEQCEKSGKLYLTTSPAGGKWIGPGSQYIQLEASTSTFYFNTDMAPPGDYLPYYKVGYTTAQLCADSAPVKISIRPLPSPEVKTADGNLSYCISEPTVALTGKNATPGTGVFLLDGNLLGYGYTSSFVPKEAGPGKHQVIYRFTTSGTMPCTSSDTIYVTIEQLTTIDIKKTGKLCKGQPFDITADIFNAPNIYWESLSDPGKVITAGDGQGTSKITYVPTANEEAAQFFRLRVKAWNALVCDTAYDIEGFDIFPTPNATFTADTTKGCAPLKVTFTNQSDVDGDPEEISKTTWIFKNNLGSEVGRQTTLGTNPATFTFLEPQGSPYTVIMEVASKKGGCPATKQRPQYIQVFPSPRPDFIGKPTFTTISNPKVKFENRTDASTISDKTEWEWNFGDRYITGGGSATTKDAEWIYHDTGKYTVSLKAINSNGCNAIKTKYLYIDIRPEIIVFVPNVFTPPTAGRHLGPQKNNTFQPMISHVANAQMWVYNRWGEVMYYTDELVTLTDPKDGTYNSVAGWDGRKNGVDAPMDVYVYLIKTKSFSGKEYKYTGTITLLR